MTVRSVDSNSVSTYQAIAEYKKFNGVSLLAKIAYSSFCDAGMHSWQGFSRLPSAIINRQVSQQILHVKRAIAHLALLASLPFSLVKPNCVTNTAEFLGLKSRPQSAKARIKTKVNSCFNESVNWIKRHPHVTVGLGVATGITIGLFAYAVTNMNSLPSQPSTPNNPVNLVDPIEPIKQNNPIESVQPEVSTLQAIIYPIVVFGGTVVINQQISRVFNMGAGLPLLNAVNFGSGD